MEPTEESTGLPEDFTGKVRLFPLPNAVLLPCGTLPLRIFEPRYRELLADAMADDQLIAMATLAPGWEHDYEGRPPLAPVVCIGRVAANSPQPTGESNILLAGVQRARIQREFPQERLYREAEVELLSDEYLAHATPQRGQLRRQLVDCFRDFLQDTTLAQQQIDQLLGVDVSLGALTDIVAFTLNLNPAFKQRMLEETNVDHRAEALLEQLRQQQNAKSPSSPNTPGFPPSFSVN